MCASRKSASPDMLEKFDATFDTYWESAEYEDTVPARDGNDLTARCAAREAHVDAPLLSARCRAPATSAEMLEKLGCRT